MLQGPLGRRLARWLLAAAALATALPAGAQEPEDVYARYHRAMMAGDVDEMMRQAAEAQRADLARMSAAERAATAKMAAAMIPRGYTVRARSLNPDGQGGRLHLAGQGAGLLDGKPETLYGVAQMVKQRGEWKVASVEWNNRDPGLPGPAAPGREAPKPAAAQPHKPAAPAGPMAPVGAIEGTPVLRKLGTQKPPCVYKPVMTAEDLENCR